MSIFRVLSTGISGFWISQLFNKILLEKGFLLFEIRKQISCSTMKSKIWISRSKAPQLWGRGWRGRGRGRGGGRGEEEVQLLCISLMSDPSSTVRSVHRFHYKVGYHLGKSACPSPVHPPCKVFLSACGGSWTQTQSLAHFHCCFHDLLKKKKPR